MKGALKVGQMGKPNPGSKANGIKQSKPSAPPATKKAMPKPKK